MGINLRLSDFQMATYGCFIVQTLVKVHQIHVKLNAVARSLRQVPGGMRSSAALYSRTALGISS